MQKGPYLLYLGNYLNEYICNLRKLPSRNPAGSNRMARIANALALNYKPIILSPAISLNINFDKKNIHKKPVLKHHGKVVVFFSKTLSIPFLGLIYSYFTYFFSVIIFIYKTKTRHIVIYNFDPILVVIVLFVKTFYRKIKIVHNIEDISIPNLKDFRFKSEDKPLLQIVFYFCMNIIVRFSDSIIIPTTRFLQFLPKNKPYHIVTGCLNVNKKYDVKKDQLIDILFSGKIAIEHGIDIFMDAIKKLDKEISISKKIRVTITGAGPKELWLNNQISELKNILITYYGFVSDADYKIILNNADICVALQREDGRHSKYKTPSKVYEYLGNSKLVIATDVGDLNKLSEEIIIICKPLNCETLSLKLKYLIYNYENLKSKRNSIYDYAFKNFDSSIVGKRLFSFINDSV